MDRVLLNEHILLIEMISAPATAAPASPTIPGLNPVLQMHSTLSSLQDKAQEEMSDFERDYPW